MSLLEHIDELRARLIYILATVGVIATFCFTFNIREVNISDYKIYYPYPDIFNSISTTVFKKMQEDLLPGGVSLIQTSPAQVMMSLFYISIFLGILFGMPMIVYQIGKFVNPGLYPHEKRLLRQIIVPVSGLFAAGCMFAYYLVTPLSLAFLYKYGFAVGASLFISTNAFISFVLLFSIGFGFAFQLPVIMVVLSTLGVVEPQFWKENFKIAVFAMFLFGAVITPGGNGVTMTLVAMPMVVLYLAGYYLSKRRKKR